MKLVDHWVPALRVGDGGEGPEYPEPLSLVTTMNQKPKAQPSVEQTALCLFFPRLSTSIQWWLWIKKNRLEAGNHSIWSYTIFGQPSGHCDNINGAFILFWKGGSAAWLIDLPHRPPMTAPKSSLLNLIATRIKLLNLISTSLLILLNLNSYPSSLQTFLI